MYPLAKGAPPLRKGMPPPSKGYANAIGWHCRYYMKASAMLYKGIGDTA